MKLLQISGKRVLQSFQHSKSQPIAATTDINTAATTAGQRSSAGRNKKKQQQPSSSNNINNSPNNELHAIDENSEDMMTTHNENAMDDDHDDTSDGDDENNDDDYDSEEEEEGEEVDVEEFVSVECVGFSASEYKWIASGGLDKTLKIWDTVSGACRGICTHPASVVSLQWHNTLPVVTTAALDCVVRLFDARAGTLLQELTGHSDMVTSIIMAPLPPPSMTNSSDNSNTASASDVIVSVSDDRTARVFQIDIPALLLQQQQH